jgi:amino acid transporter
VPSSLAVRAPGRIGIVSLVAATYLAVAGGPFGLEDIVSRSGYGGAILILLITPLIWSLPTALMVSELSSAIPEEGGFYVWVRRGLGRFWGFQEAWLSLAASVFDMAIYPTLFVSYLGHLAPRFTAGARGAWIGVGLIAVCALWNMCGAKVVGVSSTALGVLLLSPFAALTCYAVFQHRQFAGQPVPLRQVDFLGGILVAMWNYMGWDNISTVANDVDKPQRAYPIAMSVAVLTVAFTYILPVAAVSMTGLDANRWSTGSWAGVAQSVLPGALGAGAGVAITLAAMLGSAGTLNVLTMSIARLPAVMAEDGYLPAALNQRTRSGAPWVAILGCAAAWALCLQLSFSKLIALDVLLTGLSVLLEFAALVALRVREPGLRRPYRVPGGLIGAIIIGIPPLILLALTAMRTDAEQVGPFSALQLGGILIALGVAWFSISETLRIRRHYGA